jgi:hypothetical protein
MHYRNIVWVIGLLLVGCQGASYDRDTSRRILYGDSYDYYYGSKGDPVANDPDFSYGWDIGP